MANDHDSNPVDQWMSSDGRYFNFHAASEGRLVLLRPLPENEKRVYTVSQLAAGLTREDDAVRDVLSSAEQGDPPARSVVRDVALLLVKDGVSPIECRIRQDNANEPVLEIRTYTDLNTISGAWF